MGAGIEAALGHRRWQGFVEAGAARVTLGPVEHGVDGARIDAGIGVRWLARATPLDAKTTIEMLLEAAFGAQQFSWDRGGQLRRPDVALGVGWQLRHLARPALSARMIVRVMFAPTDREAAMAICRGGCPAPASSSSAGISVGLGVAW